ncbi:TPT-domain-containing protein [Basidiobolus meristosporus CBS 931.73]|uniref:TPT-domain-containing protein n=1 Tax=Basidiobolus meristosporus CBS 931.73 TaxID=1314790 RepID=A0A1Y1YY53_9FUNG|nr:TPT-domain-containing protein [Basidiobolus meristosporus CBS 931.73]|eukprot:ORY02876.1 TPT-domain-containing protein [Basidiobolus meristosporus CBS 931.73]
MYLASKTISSLPTVTADGLLGTESGGFFNNTRRHRSKRSDPSPQINFLPSSAAENVYSFLPSIKLTSTVKFCLYCLLWYSTSSITNNIGKSILTQFSYPVTLTFVQFGLVATFALVISHFFGTAKIHPPTKEIILPTIPISLFAIGGHVFSSVALSQVPVSVVHTIKALAPLFTVLLHKILYGASYSTGVYFSLLPLTVGVMLAFTFQLNVSITGFIYALISCIIFVVQNMLSKKVLSKDTKKLDKLNILFYSTICSFILMFPLWIYSEGFQLLFGEVHTGRMVISTYQLLFDFLLNGLTHYGQIMSSITVLSLTTTVTYSIASLFKRVFVIVSAIIWFRQPVSVMQMIGFSLTFFGLYLYDKAKTNKSVETQEMHTKSILPTFSSSDKPSPQFKPSWWQVHPQDFKSRRIPHSKPE